MSQKNNFYISLAIYLVLTAIVAYQEWIYVPVLKPLDDVELRVEGVQFLVGYIAVFLISLLLFCVLSVGTMIGTLIVKYKAGTKSDC